MSHIRYYILLLLTLLSTLAWAEGDDTAPQVTIGGSVYGGGKMGAILDTDDFNSVDVTYPGAGRTHVVINNAIIGTDESVEDGMGNVFGGGFGPAARVMHSKVEMKGGVIRNSLYGGGEIAAVGHGVMDPPIDKVPILNEVKRQGTTTVEMYRGHVERDVFGGGRGFTYASVDGSISAARLYTDGYVFGSTKVRIYGGVIGTRESMKEGYGNVFGGGNVGFMYSGNLKKIAGESTDIKNVQFLEEGKPYYVIPDGKPSTFYADPADATSERAGDLSIACDVLIEPWCRVKSAVFFNEKNYSAGRYLTTDELKYLKYKEKSTSGDTETVTKVNTDIWNNLEDDGITIYNAVFAGGNVSTGDDKVYAETTTVFGNAVATVNDLFYRDLVTIGTSSGKEHTGGLYGDGNLTFVDGYRELSLSCYGTDYENLTSVVSSTEYNALNDREKAYYQSKYRCIVAQPPYAVGAEVDELVYESFTETEKQNWVFAGFRSRYAGRLLNTIQRADFAGMFGSRLVLQGAMDRVLTKEGDNLSFEDYTINRVGELSLNKQPVPGEPLGSDNCRGNYFGIYNKVNYLGALTSDVRFGKDITDAGDGADVWEDTEDGSSVEINSVSHDLTNSSHKSYYDWKTEHFSVSQLKNLGTSKHLIALASGVALELKQEPTGNNPSHWGPITGVIQLDLLNVVQGEGGGFVYARNEHGYPSRRKVTNENSQEVNYVRHFLSSYNLSGQAATHEEYEYAAGNLQDMQTSGNFIKSRSTEHGEAQYIVDDCYPVHNKKTSGNLDEAHYWYIHGTIYVYNMYISAYTGAARMYQGSTGLQIPTGENGTLNLVEVQNGYYCYNPPTDENPSPLPVIVNDVEYYHGDPISWWDYHKYLEVPDDPKQEYFKLQTSDFGQNLNNMSHEKGFVLSLELNDPASSSSDPFAFWNPTSYPTADYAAKGPSFSTTTSKRYGQTYYSKNSYISSDEVDNPNFGSKEGLSEVTGYWLCTESLQLNTGGNFLLTKGVLVPDGDIEGLIRKYVAIKMETTEDQIDLNSTDTDVVYWKGVATADIEQKTSRCYQVTQDGYYGGTPYTDGKKYDALEGWSKLSDSDRNDAPVYWSYNADAIDLLNVTDLNTRYNIGGPDKPGMPQENVRLNAFSEAIVSLYMSRDSRLLSLQQNRDMTVHFQYSYGETIEHHYINITIDFKNELPDVGRLEDPGLVLPGTKIAFKQPTVKAAYNVSGGGWEYYENAEDAGGHIRGKKFTNRDEPFYWYQDGFYVSYYAETMFGRTYSENSVEVKVANYHDLKDVLEDPRGNYLGIGMRKTYPAGTSDEDKQRSPKVYINDYTDDGESGLDLLKELYDKTLDVDDILQPTVEGCDDLEIILKSNLEPGDPWTTIGSGTGEPCFKGNLHGDGYTISGLTSSLFHSLCGNVYNLGVTGEFPSGSSGIADTNSGRIENCWVYDTSDSEDDATVPIANGGTIVNCYYNKDKFTTDNPPNGAIGKDPVAFYNGNVAYELNGFYLKEHNAKVAAGDLTGSAYNTEGNLTGLTPNYVEKRYADGDFVYAGGELLPQDEDVHYGIVGHDDTTDEDIYGWTANYPDDYIFFGQSLTYGHGNVIHQDLPGRIGEVDGESNRVYRAPAYFQNATASKAYYNDHAVFAAQSADGSHDVYPHMTAIDFTGFGTTSSILDHANPLLSFKNADLTQNLLVYAGAGDKSVLKAYLDDNEPTYSETTSKYHNVPVVLDEDIVDPSLGPVIRGHAVYLNNVDDGQAYQAEYDHFLVDRQEFFAPIAYSFIGNKRMWYQRQPDNYVEINEGWEVVSLPFTADLVTTQDKGEITHFYKETDRATLLDSKKSHEYWLREYGQDVTPTSDDEILVAVFNYPDQVTGEDAKYKDVSNTFLWDYYYSKEGSGSSERVPQLDENQDTYREFYQSSRSYEGYPFLTAGTPYLIGFPGKKYYEFDLSGVFEAKPKHSLESIPKIGAQVITFASKENGTIPVSAPLAVNGGTDVPYNFWANFIETEMPTGSYVLNEVKIVEDETHVQPAGNGFYPAAVGAKTVPFRPFFTTSTKAARQRTRGILFGYGDRDEREKHEAEPREADEPGRLIIRSGRQRIIVSSSLSESTTVRIVNVSGITLHTFDIAPGETIEKFIPNQGVYIVQTINGRYTKKLAVK